MKGLTIRFIKNEDRLDLDVDAGYFFKQGFTKEQMNANKFYYNKSENVIVQVNNDYNHIDCIKHKLLVSPIERLAKKDYFNIIKEVSKVDGKFYLQSLDADLDDYLTNMRLHKLHGRKPKDYLLELESEFDGIYPELNNICLKDTENRIYFYSIGTIVYSKINHSIPKESEYMDILNYLGKFTSLLKNVENIIPIGMGEREIVEHPLSNLHLLMAYIELNKESLPKELQTALVDGLDSELKTMAKKYKSKKIYKNSFNNQNKA